MLTYIPFYINSIPLQGRYIVLQYELYDINVFINSLQARPRLVKACIRGKIKTVSLIKTGLSFKGGRRRTGFLCRSVPY